MKIKWNEYTWYSKLSAVIFFIGIFPAWTFYLGTQYEKTIISLGTIGHSSTSYVSLQPQNDKQKAGYITMSGNTIDTKKVMEYLFGAYNKDTDTYNWTPNTADTARLQKYLDAGVINTVDGQEVSVIGTTTKPNGDFLLLTASSNCEAKICGAIIGGFEFSNASTSTWNSVAQNNVIDVVGCDGSAGGDATPIDLGNHKGFLLDSGCIEQGYSSDSLHIFSPIDSSFNEVLNFPDAGGDNSGIGIPQYSYASKLTVLTSQTNDWPDIKIVKKGTGIDRHTDKTFVVNETHIFHFNAKQYVEIGA